MFLYMVASTEVIFSLACLLIRQSSIEQRDTLEVFVDRRGEECS